MPYTPNQQENEFSQENKQHAPQPSTAPNMSSTPSPTNPQSAKSAQTPKHKNIPMPQEASANANSTDHPSALHAAEPALSPNPLKAASADSPSAGTGLLHQHRHSVLALLVWYTCNIFLMFSSTFLCTYTIEQPNTMFRAFSCLFSASKLIRSLQVFSYVLISIFYLYACVYIHVLFFISKKKATIRKNILTIFKYNAIVSVYTITFMSLMFLLLYGYFNWAFKKSKILCASALILMCLIVMAWVPRCLNALWGIERAEQEEQAARMCVYRKKLLTAMEWICIVLVATLSSHFMFALYAILKLDNAI
ncbi:hypothetical protein NEFER03_1553 [Nematocida sp. LUAm3]|nr:hypothetical protein NEFER03_1553 [Nematocida sp. LUAm3]KAI5174586.1 hypothetical protein NEFER02_0707 [Nematocida sp. LUAm2]KAI5178008.1 hypothetical protein NEFER01_1190 [Nematocida sp. LUAm1]